MGKNHRLVSAQKSSTSQLKSGETTNLPHLGPCCLQVQTVDELNPMAQRHGGSQFVEKEGRWAVELAEMGVKLAASKSKMFGDMSVYKRRPGLSLSGELSLAPLVLNELTACWLTNVAAYEACLGATQADNFAVSSYISLVALLINRKEEAQELRAKGIINSAFRDKATLDFFKSLAPFLHVGHSYYQVFERLQEYKQERGVWIAVHRFLYKNIKTIVALLSVAGVLAGLFKTILSVKQSQL